MYFLGAGVDPKLPDKIMDPAYLDQLQHTAATVQSTVNTGAPSASIWMGETGGAYNSGHPGVTDAFMSGFWYLDNMATLARYGHQAFCRQTLIGGNYGLLNTTTLEPNPDFYTALLWSRLMGEGVLDVSTDSDSPASLRAYAHCTRGAADGSVTLLLLNLANDTNFAVSPHLGAGVASLQREEYHLTADSLHSRTMSLNGVLLKPGDDASIPDLKPNVVKADSQLIMARQSYAFVVLRGRQSSACESLASAVKLTVI
jgi:heparanase 1